MKLYIKNMVCNRCINIVKHGLNKLDILYHTVELGEVVTRKKIASPEHKLLYDELRQSGLELIDVNMTEIILKIKRGIADQAHFSDKGPKTSNSGYEGLVLIENPNLSINKLFAQIKGVTIEKFIIRNKIEHVKELLARDDLDLADIAIKTRYSNVTKLTSQFKSITGLTPSHYRQIRRSRNFYPEMN